VLTDQILQNTIDGFKTITRREVSVVENEGRVVATTDEGLADSVVEGVEAFMSSPAESQLVQGCQYFKVFDGSAAEFAIIVRGEDEEAYRIGKIAAFHIQCLLVAYKERFNPDNFIKNLLSDNLLLADISARAKKLRIENETRRVVYLIETDIDKDYGVIELLRNIFPAKTKDFIADVDEKSIVLVKELAQTDGTAEIERIANEIHGTLSAETLCKVFVAAGSVVEDLKNISASYNEAKMSLEVCKIFSPGKFVINFSGLGIGRLIYHMSLPACKMFADETFRGVDVDSFDEETLSMANMLFENNLNVSETSRHLYIHRNTLVYRLDRFYEQTGIDLRLFNDAVAFKFALMVSKFIKYKEAH